MGCADEKASPEIYGSGGAGKGEMRPGQFNFMGPGWQEDEGVEACLRRPSCP